MRKSVERRRLAEGAAPIDAVTVEVEQEGEGSGQSHPERGPAQGFAEADGARGAVEDAEIEHQHEEHEGEEQDPRQEVGEGRHDRAVFSKSYHWR